MDTNIRFTIILIGLALMVHAGYVLVNCGTMEEFEPVEYYLNDCDDKKTQIQLQWILGLALFVGMMTRWSKKSKD